MKKLARYVLIGLGSASILTVWLFTGVFRDREFSTVYLFTKHRPSFKVFFFAPLGESDKRIEDLTLSLQKEEKAWGEFVFVGGGYNRKVKLWQ